METCRGCLFREGERCRVYAGESIVDASRSTCNEGRFPGAGEAPGKVDPPRPGAGIYDLREEKGQTVARLRRPRRRRDETPGAWLARLGGALRSPTRLGGTEVAAEWLLAEGTPAWGELRSALLASRYGPGRVAALRALEQLDDLRLPSLLRRTVPETEDELLLAELARALARRGDPAVQEPLRRVGLPTHPQARVAAQEAALIARGDWDALVAAGGERAEQVLARWRRNRAAGALLGALSATALEPPLLLAFREATEAARQGRDDVRPMARAVFRWDAPAPAGSDAVAAALVTPWATRLALPELLPRLAEAAELAQVPPARHAAAAAAAQLLRRAIGREGALDPGQLLEKAAQAIEPIHAGFARALASGGKAGLRNTALALASGLTTLDDPLALEPAAPAALRACLCVVHGAWGGTGAWPLATLDALPADGLELVRALASETV